MNNVQMNEQTSSYIPALLGKRPLPARSAATLPLKRSGTPVA